MQSVDNTSPMVSGTLIMLQYLQSNPAEIGVVNLGIPKD